MDQPVFLLLASKTIYISSVQRVQYEYLLPMKSTRAEAERIVEILYKRRRILGRRKIGSGRIELFYEALQHMFRAIRFFHAFIEKRFVCNMTLWIMVYIGSIIRRSLLSYRIV